MTNESKKRGRAASVVVGQVYTDKDGLSVTVKEYKSATKVLVQWGDGTTQYKSVQQLKSGNFSQRTRKTKCKSGSSETVVEQPYQQQEEVIKVTVQGSENSVDNLTPIRADAGMYHSPSLFAD